MSMAKSEFAELLSRTRISLQGRAAIAHAMASKHGFVVAPPNPAALQEHMRGSDTGVAEISYKDFEALFPASRPLAETFVTETPVTLVMLVYNDDNEEHGNWTWDRGEAGSAA